MAAAVRFSQRPPEEWWSVSVSVGVGVDVSAVIWRVGRCRVFVPGPAASVRGPVVFR
jgi:hypothetical protein